MNTKRINIWSSPRNVSTALMYSWRERADTAVVDEPLYAYYLSRSERQHPGAAEVIGSQATDADEVFTSVMLADYGKAIVVFKQMAKHLLDIDFSKLEGFENVFLTRNPAEMLASFQVQVPDVTAEDTGFIEMLQLAEHLIDHDRPVVVVDSKDLLSDPASSLRKLCAFLEVPFDDAMLSWPPGPKPEDGVWAKYWYHAVHASTGWQPWKQKAVDLDERGAEVLKVVQPLYEQLRNYSELDF